MAFKWHSSFDRIFFLSVLVIFSNQSNFFLLKNFWEKLVEVEFSLSFHWATSNNEEIKNFPGIWVLGYCKWLKKRRIGTSKFRTVSLAPVPTHGPMKILILKVCTHCVLIFATHKIVWTFSYHLVFKKNYWGSSQNRSLQIVVWIFSAKTSVPFL